MKRFYKEQETVWIKEIKKTGVIKTLDIANLQAEIDVNGEDKKYFSFTEIDKYRAKETVNNNKQSKNTKFTQKDTILIAKVHPKAIIPSKEIGDAGYDFYACFDEEELFIPRFKPILIPTGLATSMLPKYYLNLKHERGSTGIHAMAILSGVVDSVYRGQIFINITPLYKDIVISKDTDVVLESEDTIIYPYKKAIAQGTFDVVPDLRIKEISYEDLKLIPSTRGNGKLGSSEK